MLAEVSLEVRGWSLETEETLTVVSKDDLAILKERFNDSDAEICRTWVEFQDWSLHNKCDDRGFVYQRDGESIQWLKKRAEMHYHDGFTMISNDPDLSSTVYFKKCGLQRMGKKLTVSETLVDALSKDYGNTTYLRLDLAC